MYKWTNPPIEFFSKGVNSLYYSGNFGQEVEKLIRKEYVCMHAQCLVQEHTVLVDELVEDFQTLSGGVSIESIRVQDIYPKDFSNEFGDWSHEYLQIDLHLARTGSIERPILMHFADAYQDDDFNVNCYEALGKCNGLLYYCYKNDIVPECIVIELQCYWIESFRLLQLRRNYHGLYLDGPAY